MAKEEAITGKVIAVNEFLVQILIFTSIVMIFISIIVHREEKRQWVNSFFQMDKALIKKKIKLLNESLTILDRYMAAARAAGSKISQIELLVVMAVFAALTGAASYAAFRYIPMGIAGFFAGTVIPYFYFLRKKDKRRKIMTKQLSPALKQFENYLKAGCSKIQALERLAGNTPEPLGTVFGNILAKINTGVPLVKAFESECPGVPVYDFKLLTVVITIHSDIGGKLEESIHNLAKTMDAKEKLTLKIDSTTQETKVSSYITAIVPTMMFLIFRFFAPEYINQLTKYELGKFGLLASFILIAAGVVVVRKMSSVKIDEYYK